MAANAQKLMGRTTTVQSAAIAPQQQLIASPADTATLKDISKSLTNIIQLLSQQNVQTRRDGDETRKNQERSRRQGIELGLEGSFAAVKNVAQSVVAPVKSILDQIIQFFVTIFLGRALILLLNWFADPNNKNKIRSIMRFLSDWWPSLVAGYILFGTGFGRVVRKVAGVAIGATARLVVIAARLVKAIATGKGLKGAAAAFSGGGRLGGLKGFALRGGLAAAATIGTGVAVNRMMGGGEEQAPQLNVPGVPAVPALGAAGGGLANLKDLFSSSSSSSGLTSKFNPFTSFFGSGGLASVMQGLGGTVSGPKGIDKVPAMLTDGEFVMSRGAVQKFGVNTLEAMNAAGGGTNQPKIIRGVPHAAGGGLIGDDARTKYDTKHGAGAYDKESARRKASLAQEDAAAEAKKNKKPVYVQSDYVRQLKERAKTQGTTSTLSINGMRIPGGGALAQQLQGMQAPKLTAPKVNANIDPNAVAGSIQSGIMSTYKKLGAKTTTDQQLSAEWNKKALEKQRPWWDKAGLFGGGSRVAQNEAAARNKRDQENKRKQQINQKARDEYDKILDNPNHPDFEKAWDDGKGYMQSLKKKYESQPQPQSQKPTSKPSQTAPASQKPKGPETSQQRLDRLSSAGKGKGGGGYGGLSFGGSKGKRFDAEAKAQAAENMKRGGAMGQLGRTFGRIFGDKKVAEQDKASQARVKQSGAASIGKYYSSSDGKYYGSYEQAQKARQARLGATKPKAKGITPTPKPKPKVVSAKPKVAGGGMGGGRGSGGRPSVPNFPTSNKSSRKEKNIYGIK